jgi:hypothetical protein
MSARASTQVAQPGCRATLTDRVHLAPVERSVDAVEVEVQIPAPSRVHKLLIPCLVSAQRRAQHARVRRTWIAAVWFPTFMATPTVNDGRQKGAGLRVWMLTSSLKCSLPYTCHSPSPSARPRGRMSQAHVSGPQRRTPIEVTAVEGPVVRVARADAVCTSGHVNELAVRGLGGDLRAP